MQALTPSGQNIINDISQRYGLSVDSAVRMLVAVNNGGGSMAQFSCPELGSGQWMRGGMTMVSDLFNHNLKATVNNLCGELSNALANNQIFQQSPHGGMGCNDWWPSHLGVPSSSGSQNNTRYAVFPQSRRLAVLRDGHVSVFDTLNHQIGGVSQQQGGNSSLTFSSQFGTVSSLSLPLVSGPGLQGQNAPAVQNNFAQAASQAPQGISQSSSEVLSLLEKIGQLRDAGVLTPDEFNSKKAELLGRL